MLKLLSPISYGIVGNYVLAKCRHGFVLIHCVLTHAPNPDLELHEFLYDRARLGHFFIPLFLNNKEKEVCE